MKQYYIISLFLMSGMLSAMERTESESIFDLIIKHGNVSHAQYLAQNRVALSQVNHTRHQTSDNLRHKRNWQLIEPSIPEAKKEIDFTVLASLNKSCPEMPREIREEILTTFWREAQESMDSSPETKRVKEYSASEIKNEVEKYIAKRNNRN